FGPSSSRASRPATAGDGRRAAATTSSARSDGAGVRMRFRSVLFVPGHRLDLLAKVPRWRPDAVVVDLEDAVSAADKDAARGAVQETELRVPGSTVLVRVNPPGT